MSLNNPREAAYPIEITGLDKKISQINDRLNNIVWLSITHNRAWNLPEVRESNLYRQPRIYSGAKEYWNVMPNDDQQAFSFMVGVGPVLPVGDNIQPYMRPDRWTKRLDLIFFLDLSKIDSAKQYVYTEELNEDVLIELKKVPGVLVNQIWMEDIRDVYEGFDLTEIKLQHLYYPFAGIRYELEVSYSIESLFCVNTVNDPIFEAEALLVFARMPTLTESQKIAINKFIGAEKLAGTNNYAKYDEFFLLKLGSTNGLIGFKIKTAVAFGGITFGPDGVIFNGTNAYLDTNWNPAIDAVNYAQNDANVSFFVKTIDAFSTARGLYGGRSAPNLGNITVFDTGSIISAVNGGSYTDTSVVATNDSTISIARTASNAITHYRNGIAGTPGVINSVAIESFDQYIGALNQNDTAIGFWDGIMSTFLISSAIGLDQNAHDNNVKQLLTDLEVS